LQLRRCEPAFLPGTIELYNSLRSPGKDVTFLRYPGMGHGFSGPALQDYWGRSIFSMVNDQGTTIRLLDGTVVAQDKGETEKLYGREYSGRELIRGRVPPPAASRALLAELDATWRVCVLLWGQSSA
jgi:hypothetical protein